MELRDIVSTVWFDKSTNLIPLSEFMHNNLQMNRVALNKHKTGRVLILPNEKSNTKELISMNFHVCGFNM